MNDTADRVTLSAGDARSLAERALQLASEIGQLHTPADLLALAQE